jgi:hypothetical protein
VGEDYDYEQDIHFGRYDVPTVGVYDTCGEYAYRGPMTLDGMPPEVDHQVIADD